MGEHHRTYGGYSRDIMTGISTFHRRVHSRISLHLRTKYSRQEDEKVKRFDRVQKDKSRGEGSSGKSGFPGNPGLLDNRELSVQSDAN